MISLNVLDTRIHLANEGLSSLSLCRMLKIISLGRVGVGIEEDEPDEDERGTGGLWESMLDAS